MITIAVMMIMMMTIRTITNALAADYNDGDYNGDIDDDS